MFLLLCLVLLLVIMFPGWLTVVCIILFIPGLLLTLLKMLK